MISRRQMLARTGASLAALAVGSALRGADAQVIVTGGNVVTSGGSVLLGLTPRPLGLNLAQNQYYDTQLAFLNVMKQAGNGHGDSLGACWNTANGTTAETSEEQYLQLDANGYVTSLAASPVPAGGQLFTFVRTATVTQLGLGNGATYRYPADTYVFMWQGKGTFVFSGDVTSLTNASAGCTITGLQVVSTNAWGTVNSVTLQGSGSGAVLSPSASGIKFEITAIPDSSNYPKAMACVQSTYLSNYNAGQIFHPNFLAYLGKWPLASLRGMKPLQIESEVIGGPFGAGATCTFTANPSAGNTSAVLSAASIAALFRCGTRTITLQNGQTISVTFTAGNNTVTFGTAVSSNCTSAYFYLHSTNGFSDRSNLGDVTYTTTRGWPLEILWELCNTLNCPSWTNFPVTWSAADINSAATLMQSTLNSNIFSYVEFGNEVWNSGYAIQHYAVDVSATVFATSDGISWYGMQVALGADQIASVFGNPGFDNLIQVQMGGQSANTAVIVDALTTPKWTGNTPPYQRVSASGKKTVKAPCLGLYFGEGPIPSADYTFIQAQADPVAAFFGSWTQNPYLGNTFTYDGTHALPSTGWFGWVAAQVTANLSAVAGYGYTFVNSYEETWQFDDNGPPSPDQEAFLIQAARDPRIQAQIYAFFGQMATAGCKTQNIFDFCETYGVDQWGSLESTMQPLPGPPRWLGAVQWGSGA